MNACIPNLYWDNSDHATHPRHQKQPGRNEEHHTGASLQTRGRGSPVSVVTETLTVSILLPYVSDQRHRSQEEDRHFGGSEFILAPFSVLQTRDSQCVNVNNVDMRVPGHDFSCCQVLSLMEAQAQFFQHGHQSLSELDKYRQQLNEEVIACCSFALLNFGAIMGGSDVVFGNRTGFAHWLCLINGFWQVVV